MSEDDKRLRAILAGMAMQGILARGSDALDRTSVVTSIPKLAVCLTDGLLAELDRTAPTEQARTPRVGQ